MLSHQAAEEKCRDRWRSAEIQHEPAVQTPTGLGPELVDNADAERLFAVSPPTAVGARMGDGSPQPTLYTTTDGACSRPRTFTSSSLNSCRQNSAVSEQLTGIEAARLRLLLADEADVNGELTAEQKDAAQSEREKVQKAEENKRTRDKSARAVKAKKRIDNSGDASNDESTNALVEHCDDSTSEELGETMTLILQVLDRLGRMLRKDGLSSSPSVVHIRGVAMHAIIEAVHECDRIATRLGELRRARSGASRR